jgi:hypothetical protein
VLLQTGWIGPLLQAPLEQCGHHAQGLEFTGQVVAQRGRDASQQGITRRFFVRGFNRGSGHHGLGKAASMGEAPVLMCKGNGSVDRPQSKLIHT